MFRPYSSVGLALLEASRPKNTIAEFGLLVKPAIDRPGNCTASRTPGIFSADVADAAHDLFGAIQRRGVRQLHERDQVLLVLHRDEALRHDLEQAPRQRPSRPANTPITMLLCASTPRTPRT